MPPRWLSLLIVAFWLGTTGWLFWHDLWPRWQPGQPPPFTIDLVQEVQTKRPPATWTVRQDGKKVFQARTGIRHPDRDVYELYAEFHTLPGYEDAVVGGCQVKRMDSFYRVDPEGRLRQVEVRFQVRLPAADLLGGPRGDLTLHLQGQVRDGTFAPRLEVVGDAARKFNLPAVKVAHSGAVLLPLHPPDRLRGLRPGQRWRQPVLDPVADSVRALLGPAGGERWVNARVLPGLEPLSYGRRRDVPCLVVEYQGDDASARTWVEEHSGRVLRQEANVGGSTWVMDRE